MLRSVVDQVFYVVAGTRHNLRTERVQPQWRSTVAVEMYEFCTAFGEAAPSGKEIEESTGFAGQALYAEANE